MIDEARNEPDTPETTLGMYLDLLEADIRLSIFVIPSLPNSLGNTN